MSQSIQNSQSKPSDEAARQTVLVVGQEGRGTIEVTGPDAASWLNAIVTCDLSRVRDGHGAWGLLLTKQGKIQSDLFVVEPSPRADARPRERLLVSVQPGRAAELVEALDRMLIMEDAELAEVSDEWAWFALHGPLSDAVARSLAEAHGGAVGRIDWTGLGGAALALPRESLSDIATALNDDANVVLGTPDDWLRLRLEHGLPEMGVDFTTEDNPHQAALERRAVSWDKGCYLGQEVVCMVDMRGKVRRRLACVSLDEAVAPEPEVPVTIEGREGPIGAVTSSAVSHRLGRGVVLAKLLTHFADAGTRVRIGSTQGTVMDPPLGA